MRATVTLTEGDHVVLAGGAAATPAILQRSGIGRSLVLETLGIPLVADLPVGDGIQDHVGFWLQLEHQGAQPGANGARGNATLRYSSELPHSRPGDLLVVAANPAASDAAEVAFGVKLAYCLSRGSSQIVSRDPSAAPDIRMNLLVDEGDRALARHAMRSSVQMLAPHTSAVRDRNGAVVDAGWSDADVDAWLRACARDTSHLTGGARMGDADEETTVVDPRPAGTRRRRPLGRRPVGLPDHPACEHLPDGGDDRRARGRLRPRRVTPCLPRSVSGQSTPVAVASRMPRSASRTLSRC